MTSMLFSVQRRAINRMTARVKEHLGASFVTSVSAMRFLIIPRHTKYVDVYIVFVFPSVSVCACVYVRTSANILCQTFA